MPASSRLRALLALLLFLPATLCCYLLANLLASVYLGVDTPDRARLALCAVQILGLGLPCLVACEIFRLGVQELGARRLSWVALGLTALLVLGLWPGFLTLDALRADLPFLQDGRQQDLFKVLVSPGAGGLAAILGVLAIVPAFMEEGLFRGILHPLLEKAWGRGVAIGLSAALFSAFHMSREQIVVQFLLGLVLGWLRSSTGSLWPCVLAHALHNGLSVLGMLWFPEWVLPPYRIPPWPVWAGGILLALLAAVLLGRRALKTPPAQG